MAIKGPTPPVPPTAPAMPGERPEAAGKEETGVEINLPANIHINISPAEKNSRTTQEGSQEKLLVSPKNDNKDMSSKENLPVEAEKNILASGSSSMGLANKEAEGTETLVQQRPREENPSLDQNFPVLLISFGIVFIIALIFFFLRDEAKRKRGGLTLKEKKEPIRQPEVIKKDEADKDKYKGRNFEIKI